MYNINLIKVINLLENSIRDLKIEKNNQIREINNRYDIKIKELETALSVNLEMNTACLECGGRGVISFASASGNTERETCKKCGGSGVIHK